MTAPTLTFSLTNGSTADASQVMQNFTDLLNGYTDATKDLSISALTCAGTATLNGHVNLGNSSADDLIVTASLAATLPVKTTASYDIGTSSLKLRTVYAGAINLLTTGGTAADLDYYEEYSDTSNATWSNTSVNPASSALKIVKVGKLCVARFTWAVATIAGSGPLTFTSIPSRFRPTANLTLAGGYSQGSSTGYPTSILLSSTGVLDFYRDNTANYTVGQTVSNTGLTFSWVIT